MAGVGTPQIIVALGVRPASVTAPLQLKGQQVALAVLRSVTRGVVPGCAARLLYVARCSKSLAALTDDRVTAAQRKNIAAIRTVNGPLVHVTQTKPLRVRRR